jgi:hypothetical protein
MSQADSTIFAGSAISSECFGASAEILLESLARPAASPLFQST